MIQPSPRIGPPTHTTPALHTLTPVQLERLLHRATAPGTYTMSECSSTDCTNPARAGEWCTECIATEAERRNTTPPTNTPPTTPLPPHRCLREIERLVRRRVSQIKKDPNSIPTLLALPTDIESIINHYYPIE